MNTFALDTPRGNVAKYIRRPLGESSSAGNRGTRSRSTTPNRGGRPSKRLRTDSPLSTSPIPSSHFYTSRAILYTLNKNVARFNGQVFDKFPGAKTVCNSRDQVVNEQDSFLLPIEIMNAFEPASLPPHHLELKPDCVVMLLRNLKQAMGLCNGTRLQVKHIGTKTLDCRILGGEHDGRRHYVPRIPLAPPDSNELHAPFRRIQYPVRLAFSMTINKFQGQSL